jgi:hypothetical protein
LHNLFRPAKGVKINYPKVKRKTVEELEEEKNSKREIKGCP